MLSFPETKLSLYSELTELSYAYTWYAQNRVNFTLSVHRTPFSLYSVLAKLIGKKIQYKGGEEELSISCRVGGAATSRAVTGASKKQEYPANERRKERARRRRRAWKQRRRWPAAGAASQTGEAVTSWEQP